LTFIVPCIVIYSYSKTNEIQLTWYGHVQRMAEGRLPKIALKWIPKQKRAGGRPKKKLDGRYKEEPLTKET